MSYLPIDHCFEVPVEERMTLTRKLEEAFSKRGLSIEVDYSLPESTIAYLEIKRKGDQKFGFGIGEFWFEETNIIPVIAMTHELGHYLDIMENFEGNAKIYNQTLGTQELEARAWFYAVEVCRELGFKRWDVFFKYASSCLASYFNDSFGWLDFMYGDDNENPTLEFALYRLKEKIGTEAVTIEEESRWSNWKEEQNMLPMEVLEKLFSNYTKATIKTNSVRLENDNWFEEIVLTETVLEFIKLKGMEVIYED